MRQPLTILVYPVRFKDGDWEYLLLKRTPSRDGFWQGVSGSVEKGEDLAEAAMQELQEETGFTPIKLESIDYAYSFPIDEKWRHLYTAEVEQILEHVFIAYIEGAKQPAVDPREHEEWKWCRFAEAQQLLYWPTNKEALKRVDAYLRSSQSYALP